MSNKNNIYSDLSSDKPMYVIHYYNIDERRITDPVTDKPKHKYRLYRKMSFGWKLRINDKPYALTWLGNSFDGKGYLFGVVDLQHRLALFSLQVNSDELNQARNKAATALSNDEMQEYITYLHQIFNSISNHSRKLLLSDQKLNLLELNTFLPDYSDLASEKDDSPVVNSDHTSDRQSKIIHVDFTQKSN